MVTWEIKYSKKARKDAELLKSAHLDKKAKQIIDVLRTNPFGNPPPFEKLMTDLRGKYSRRINRKHRIVYEMFKDDNIIVVYGMFSHYGD